MASKQQEQFNLDRNAQKVLDYWKNEYDVTPDAWELAQELEISEAQAEKVLARIAKSQQPLVNAWNELQDAPSYVERFARGEVEE